MIFHNRDMAIPVSDYHDSYCSYDGQATTGNLHILIILIVLFLAKLIEDSIFVLGGDGTL